MPVWLTVEIGLVETVKGERENRKWTPKESWINPLGQRRWAKPPDLSKAILLEPSKKLLFKTTLHFCASGCAARYCAVREACCTASANTRTRKKLRRMKTWRYASRAARVSQQCTDVLYGRMPALRAQADWRTLNGMTRKQQSSRCTLRCPF